MTSPAGAACGPWTNPFDLLLALDAHGVVLEVGRDRCGKDRIFMADPRAAVGSTTLGAMRHWEEDLAALIRERRLTRDEAEGPPKVPTWVRFHTSRRGNQVLRYLAPDGAMRQYWKGEDRPWRRN